MNDAQKYSFISTPNDAMNVMLCNAMLCAITLIIYMSEAHEI